MFPRWFLLSCSSLLLAAPLVFAAPSPTPASSQKASGALPALLLEVEKKYAAAETVVADFVQDNELLSMAQKKSSSGRILLKRPNKLRWETLKPDINMLVSDGRTFWFYTPPFDEGEQGQVIERRTSEVQSRLATALLAGAFSVAKDMKIEAGGESAAGTEFALYPRKGTAGSVEVIRIYIHPSKKTIDRVELKHRGGNKTTIRLSNIELGSKLRDELFYFIPPPNTDRVK